MTWGNAAQVRSFQDFAHLLDDVLYLRELDRHDLGAYAAIIIPDVMDCIELRAHARQLNDYVRNGGFLIAFSIRDIENIIDVVDLKWQPVNARDWLWWTRPNPYLEVRQPEPRHPICDAISLADMSWHWMGALEKHPDAAHILTLDDDSLSLFMDFRNLQGGGRLMVTTLDPHGHNGERFMPATTRFLEAFYPWLNRELGIDREKRLLASPICARLTARGIGNRRDWPKPSREPASPFVTMGSTISMRPYCGHPISSTYPTTRTRSSCAAGPPIFSPFWSAAGISSCLASRPFHGCHSCRRSARLHHALSPT
ncbi:hypothetical protein [Rhizobium sp. PDO1-076]|uniref:hypothetical protein n=1 Tax=Rhizobium sp. PDO1-076 TaxID=1125979 RepID=UPI0011474B4D|nr:hypothetical protein [Rhizobium sp. PDO1-076]